MRSTPGGAVAGWKPFVAVVLFLALSSYSVALASYLPPDNPSGTRQGLAYQYYNHYRGAVTPAGFHPIDARQDWHSPELRLEPPHCR